MKAGRKWLLSLLIFTVLVCMGVSQDVSAAEAYSYSNIVVYNIDGTTNSLSDYSEDMVELVYGGMTACDYVGQMLAVGEKAVAQGISIRPVLMDYASKSDSLKSYANQHPTVTVAYSQEYIKHPLSYSSRDGFTIPMVLVCDRTGSLVYKSEGPEPEALGDFLGIDVGELPHYVEETENSGRCGARLTWKLDDDGTLTISGKGEMYDDAWVSWMGREDIKKVVIENGVTNISQFAFSGCVNLTSVAIPGSVTSIDPYAFRWCSSLTGLTIPDGVSQIGMYAFLGCTDLTSIRIPGSVADIEKNPFAGCENLESITVDGENPNYRSINGVLYDADKTALIAYPTAKQSSSYVVPDGVLHIGDEAFSYCDHLTGVILPDSVTDIGYHAFGWCSSLTDLTIPDQVTDLGSLAFLGCSGLTGIRIPDSVTGIGKNAFAECSSLEQVTVGEKNQNYVSLDGILLNKEKSEIIVFPEAKQTIGGEAFKDCDKLRSITIPNNITSIGEKAFYGCSRLTSIDIPEKVTSIGDGAFKHCTNLNAITVDANNQNYTSVEGVLFNKDKTTLIIYPAKKQNSSYIIPEGVRTIEEDAFEFCSTLSDITISDSVTSIGKFAFCYCRNLSSVTVSDSVTSIGAYAFDNCSSLSRITIPNGVTEIGDGTFLNCGSMTSITIPKSVSYIGNYALGYQGILSESKMENYTIYGYTGTKAEIYANNNGFKFVDLDATLTNDSQKADNSQKAENVNQTDEKKDESGWYYVFDITQLGWGNDGFTWYYLDADGNIQTGWLNIAGKWYYMDQSGAMQTGWVSDGGTWYYMNYWGEMQTGWVYAGGSWYYLSGSGAMQTGWISDGGTWYYTDGSGAMQTGWINDGDVWYYLNGIGPMVTGWQFAGGKWYYLDGSGAMRTGWLNDGGKWYYLNASGAMQTGWYSVSGKWYYSYASGQMAANTRIGGYRVNASGEWVR